MDMCNISVFFFEEMQVKEFFEKLNVIKMLL